MTDVLPFPMLPSSKRKPLSAKSVDFIGIMTDDGRELWIERQEDILKIFKFIAENRITIFEEKQ